MQFLFSMVKAFTIFSHILKKRTVMTKCFLHFRILQKKPVKYTITREHKTTSDLLNSYCCCNIRQRLSTSCFTLQPAMLLVCSYIDRTVSTRETEPHRSASNMVETWSGLLPSTRRAICVSASLFRGDERNLCPSGNRFRYESLAEI
jgi:hypothetical protein